MVSTKSVTVLFFVSDRWCDTCLFSHLWLRAYRLDRPDSAPDERGIHREGR